jgi:hypothetical protein
MSQMSYDTFPSRRGDVNFTPATSDLGVWKERQMQASRDRRRYEPVWSLCQSFISNKQWVGWSRRDRRIVSEPNPQNRERHTVNVLTSYLMTNVGKFISDDMRPHLFFRSDSQEDESYARQANKALEYAWDEELDADDVLYDAILRMCSFGLSAIQCLWTPDRGPVIAENVPFINGQPSYDTSQVADHYAKGGQFDVRTVRGKLEWRPLSPTNILPPPGIVHERDFPWIIIERPMDLGRLRTEFGDVAKGITEQNLAAFDMAGLRDSVSDSDGVSQTTTGRLKNHAILYTGYEMPTREHPGGRRIWWAQDTKLREKEGLGYKIDGEPKIGIRFFKYNMVPDRFWPIGQIEPGIGPQRQRNRSRSQYIEMKDRSGLGRIYARPGALSVTQLPGGKVAEVIEVRTGVEFPVETLGTGPGPWMAQDIQMHDSDIDKVMGMGQVTLGQGAPGGVSAYSAMALLAEQDDRRVGPIMKAIRTNVQQLVKFTLQDIRTYWGPTKQVVLPGDNDQIDAFVFDASRMPPEVYVKVGTGAAAPRNQAAEIQKVFDLFDRSISSGAPLPTQWLYDSLEAGKALPLPITPDQVQTEKADIENMLIAKGGVVTVSETDAHDIHMREHLEAISAHQLIPGMEDVVRALQEHYAEHEQAKQSSSMPGTTAPGLQGGFGAMGGPETGLSKPIPVPPAFVNRLSPQPGNIRA